MPQVISCPHCELKLSIKPGLNGQRLSCPKCKGQFSVPAADSSGDVGFQQPGASHGPSQGGMDFLADVTGGVSGPGTTGQRTSSRPQSAPASVTKSAGAKGAAASMSYGTQPKSSLKSRGSKKTDPMMQYYILGGIGAAVVLFVVAVIALGGSSPPQTSGNDNVRFGLPESRRKVIFEQFIKSVDNYGMSKACVTEWRETGTQYKLGDKEIEQLIAEGFDAGWLMPSADSVTASKKMNRVEWIKKRNELHREPQFAK